MNKQNRRDLASIISDLETLRDEEQDKYDNMPESLQQAENGEMMTENIDHMTNALGTLGNIEI